MILHEFLSHLAVQRRLSEHTVTAYRTDLKQFARFCESRFDLSRAADVQRLHVKSWLTDLVVNRSLAASSIRRKLSSVKAFYKFRLQRGLQREDPTRKIPVPKLPKGLPTTIAGDDLERLFAAFPDPLTNEAFPSLRDHLLLALLYQTGMRRAELIGLRAADVDLARNRLSVMGKGNKQRLIPIGEGLAELLAAYGELREFTFPEAPGALLLTDRGRAMYPKYVYNKVVDYLGGVSTEEKRHPHVLRHTFATDLLAGGADLNAVKSLLGHASLAATQVYTHSDISRLQEVYRLAHPEGGRKMDESASKK